MSLNGLDTVQVNQIYESTVAEAGGWFLLHYITRDEVDVYKSGSGGSPEFKEAIEQYEEKSPLYGLLIYRRKRVLLKYVPEGTSRLLQARLTVHLQSVIERFPHDALLSLEAAAELTDTALSSSVSALKTSGSIRSLNSLKKRPLTEIAEDASEILLPDTQASTPIETPLSESHNSLPLSATTEQFIDSEDKGSTSTTKATRGLGDNSANNSSATQQPSTAIDISDSQRRPSFTHSDSAYSTGTKSLQSALSPNSDTPPYLYKLKVKLAPRPVEESRHSNPYARPTSSLPAGVQLQSRERTTTSPTMYPPNSARVTNFPLSPIDRYTNGFVQTSVSASSPTYDKRPVSRGSAATIPINVRSNDEPTLTPEKQRLMKALQKRKQQQKARQLAREGKFDDDDMAENKESQHTDDSDNFSNLNSARSAFVKDSDKTFPITQISHLDQNSLVDYQITTDRLSQFEEHANPSMSGTPPSSTIRIVPFLQDELYSSADMESDTPRDSEFPANGIARSSDNVGDNLQHTASVLQFPDWSDAHKHDLNTPLEETATSKPSTHQEQDIVSAEHDREIEPKIESYQPLVLNLPPESELSNMDLSINNESTLETPEIDTVQANSNLQASENLPIIEAHHENDQIVQNDGELSDHGSPQAEAGTFDMADYANESLPRSDSAVDITHPMQHGTKDEIHVLPYRTAVEAQDVGEDPEENQDLTPLHAFGDNTVDVSASTPLSEQQDYPDLPSNQDSGRVNPENTQTHIENADAEMDSSPVLQSDSIDKQPRSPTITPVRNSASHSEALSLSEEDSLLDELHSATVQEATSLKLPKTPPMSFSPSFARPVEARSDSVSPNGGYRSSPPTMIFLPSEASQHSQQPLQSLDASPISPITNSISESPTRTITPDISTSLSQPAEQDSSSPNLPSFSPYVPGSRQVSLSVPPAELERPASRKSAVSSLISQRIKAFEDKFSAPSSPQQTPTSAVKAQIVTLRKVSLNTPSSQQAHSGANADRNGHPSYPTPSPSPHNLAQKLGLTKATKKENLPKDAVMRDKAAKDTISKLNKGVTDNSPTTSVSPERPTIHQETKGMRSIFSSKSRKKKTNSDPSSSSSLSREGRISVDASARGNSVSPHSNRSESIERTRAPSSTESLTSEGEKKDTKKRAGLLKRLSNMGSSTHRSIAEAMTVPVSKEATIEPQESGPVKNWRSSVTLGELNIQFPDTLLWKRKHVEIDSQGFVVLAPSQAEKNSKAIMKRYHISDFKIPYVPEPDREELPYSVNLDFLDGSTIQCACDSSSGQQRVYQALTAARAAFDTA